MSGECPSKSTYYETRIQELEKKVDHNQGVFVYALWGVVIIGIVAFGVTIITLNTCQKCKI